MIQNYNNAWFCWYFYFVMDLEILINVDVVCEQENDVLVEVTSYLESKLSYKHNSLLLNIFWIWVNCWNTGVFFNGDRFVPVTF